MKKGQWIRDGELQQGGVPDCYKCGYSLENVNSHGVMWITFVSQLSPYGNLMVLCDTCAIALGEWFHPELLDKPSYVAEKDQYDAAVKDIFGPRDQ